MANFRLFADQYEGNDEPNLAAYAHAGHCLYAHKATEGARHTDTAHERRVRRAHEQGLTVLHYHFVRPDEHNPVGEVHRFWGAVTPVITRGDFVAFDYEKEAELPIDLYTPAYLEGLWNTFHALSRESAGVYGSSDFLAERTHAEWLRHRARWEANYSQRPGAGPWGKRPWAWQGSDGQEGPLPHSLEGIGACDVSELNLRTAATLRVRTAWRRRRGKH